ncbi:MAG: hypothetical protein ACRD04_02705 [Terriglobales bacterium]
MAKAWETLRWAPAFWRQQRQQRPARSASHLILAIADHFEPSIMPGAAGGFAPLEVQQQRLERWCREYPRALDAWRDAEGFPLRHTYFYPAEQYEPGLLEQLAEHCRAGWGEVEIHLHHGMDRPDTAANTRRQLEQFRNALAQRHGCLSCLDGGGRPLYAFVHGNWALANSARGRFCGVDSETAILAETGCYADLTLPAAPSPAQVSKINAVYECGLPLDRRAPHRRGRDLTVGRKPEIFPLIVQGPLALWRDGGMLPRIENSEISGRNPATLVRLQRWLQAGISVKGQPDWVFLKLHCHGMAPGDQDAMWGAAMQRFLASLREQAAARRAQLHFVTAREMTNILLAACDGRAGSPGEYRDYRLRLAGAGVLRSNSPGEGRGEG